MYPMPPTTQPNAVQPPPPQPPRRPRRRRFRWPWVTVPLACLAVAYVLSAAIAPRFDWGDIMMALRVPTRFFGRYTQLCVLGLTLIGIVAVLRILRSGKPKP